MKSMAVFSFLTLISGATFSFAAEDARCMEEYKKESARITREAERNAKDNPPGKDLDAQSRFLTPIYAALKAAADRADQCERDSLRAAPRSDARLVKQREMSCNIRAEQELDELKKRRGTRSDGSRQELEAMRDAESTIADKRRECMKNAR
jgi:hypothetical protein